MTEIYRPVGLQDVIPYLIVEKAGRLIEFIAIVFDADVLDCSHGDNKKIASAILKIGDSIIEVADSSEKFQPRPVSLHVYVPNTDIVYMRALDAGATSLYAPVNRECGERMGAVQDPFGNQWFIATHTYERTAGL